MTNLLASSLNDLTRWPFMGCESLTKETKVLEANPKWFARRVARSKSNRSIDAQIQFYGQYIQLNEQVTLQNQDPVLNEAAARLGVSLRYANRRRINEEYAGSDSRLH